MLHLENKTKFKQFKIFIMINRFFISGFLALGFFLIAFSCSTDDSIITDNTAEINQITNTAKSGTWHISSYIDSGQNETNDYTGYNFSFNDNGVLLASNGSNEIIGTWSITDENNSSNDDSNDNDDIDFNIFFSSPPNFEELSDDWDIVTTSNSKIELIDISGGNGGTDTLTFEKN